MTDIPIPSSEQETSIRADARLKFCPVMQKTCRPEICVAFEIVSEPPSQWFGYCHQFKTKITRTL